MNSNGKRGLEWREVEKTGFCVTLTVSVPVNVFVEAKDSEHAVWLAKLCPIDFSAWSEHLKCEVEDLRRFGITKVEVQES